MAHLTKVFMKYLFVQIGIFYQVIQGFFIYLLSSKPSILILNPIKSSKKIAIFAAYRKDYNASVDLTLVELKKRGFSIIFVSNRSLSKDFIRQLKNKADILIQRGNYGRCIAAYKAAYLFLHANKFYGADNILFLNDTMIFPICNTDIFWKDLDRCHEKIAGIFMSNEIHPHLQSYFIYCKNKVFLQPFFYNFWVKYIPFNSKQLIIKYGEIGFSKMINKHRLKTYTFVNQDKLRQLLVRKKIWITNSNNKLLSWVRTTEVYCNGLNLLINPSHLYSLICVEHMMLPMFKTDLISAGSFSVYEITSFLKTFKTTANKDLILMSFKEKQNRSFMYKLKSYMGMI